ncbi:MAG: hypothetical protein PHQ23_02565, partial [Candidatus Wallbacteria bacterium]|nr:hypothetical protein [Candidatus Wallbacteria bacterium]
MRKVAAFLLMMCAVFSLPAEDVDGVMKKIGYSFEEDLLGKDPPREQIEEYPISYFSRLEQLSLCEGGLTLSGNTGLIEIPSAFINSNGYFNTGGHVQHTDSNFNMQGTRYKSKKWEYIGHLNYGFRRNAECGVNVVSVKNSITSSLTNVHYVIRKDFATFNIKWTTPYKGKAVAFGAQVTNLSNE